eukprot:11376566-Alexandrium_andersonii.AAC.1
MRHRKSVAEVGEQGTVKIALDEIDELIPNEQPGKATSDARASTATTLDEEMGMDMSTATASCSVTVAIDLMKQIGMGADDT